MYRRLAAGVARGPTRHTPLHSPCWARTYAASKRLNIGQAESSASPQSAKVRKILRRQVPGSPPHTLVCTSASKCEHYHLPTAVAELTGQGLQADLIENDEVVYSRIGKSDIFVLNNGTVVAWDMSETALRQRLLGLLGQAEINPFSDIETEDMDYVESATGEDDLRSGMIGDVIYIHGKTKRQRLRDKLAFSSGLARNTKLSALEMRADSLISQVRVISKRMAAGQKIGLRLKDVEVLTGRLLQLRGALNLYSDITETPDLYWTEPELERLYDLISRKLDVEPRVKLLNQKLDYVSDMVSILKSHLSEKTSLRLEWMIIILITIEVLFELRHLFPVTEVVEMAVDGPTDVAPETLKAQ